MPILEYYRDKNRAHRPGVPLVRARAPLPPPCRPQVGSILGCRSGSLSIPLFCSLPSSAGLSLEILKVPNFLKLSSLPCRGHISQVCPFDFRKPHFSLLRAFPLASRRPASVVAGSPRLPPHQPQTPRHSLLPPESVRG